jgi:hypothetical protein
MEQADSSKTHLHEAQTPIDDTSALNPSPSGTHLNTLIFLMFLDETLPSTNVEEQEQITPAIQSPKKITLERRHTSRTIRKPARHLDDPKPSPAKALFQSPSLDEAQTSSSNNDMIATGNDEHGLLLLFIIFTCNYYLVSTTFVKPTAPVRELSKDDVDLSKKKRTTPLIDHTKQSIASTSSTNRREGGFCCYLLNVMYSFVAENLAHLTDEEYQMYTEVMNEKNFQKDWILLDGNRAYCGPCQRYGLSILKMYLHYYYFRTTNSSFTTVVVASAEASMAYDRISVNRQTNCIEFATT